MERTKNVSQTITIGAILTALVVLLQFMGAFIKLGPFSVSLVLVPIVIGAILGGEVIGAWLGFVFGAVVLLNGDAAPFLAVNVIGTIITVILKGTLVGYIAGVVYKLLSKVSGRKNLPVIVAALICPVVNTVVFLIGCFLFFMDTIAMWAGSESVAHYIIYVLVGGNFVFEVIINIVFAPVILHILKIANRN